MNRIIAILLACFLFAASAAKGQTFYENKEYGIAFGGAHYFGDLNENYGLLRPRPAAGAFMRIHVNPFIAIRLATNATQVGYDDKNSKNYFTRQRNLNFESLIVEASVQSEFNFYRFFTGELNSRFTPYLTGGIGAFYYNPYTTFNGRRYYLRPLGTEGQNISGFGDRQYNKWSMCFPIGAGFKYWLKPGVNFGMELANRLTLTDYMDDVSTTYVGAANFPVDPLDANAAYSLQDRSPELGGERLGRPGKQRGNSSSKDQYMLLLINLSFQLKTYKCPSYLRDQYMLQ